MIGRRRSTVCVLAALVVALTAGCGSGGGAGSPLTTTAGRAALDVYVTDGFTDQYKMVLATLFKIELTTDGATYQTVFSSAAGQTSPRCVRPPRGPSHPISSIRAMRRAPQGSATSATITRHRSGRGFSYRSPNGETIRDRAEIARIAAIAIPPAWTHVWSSRRS